MYGIPSPMPGPRGASPGPQSRPQLDLDCPLPAAEHHDGTLLLYWKNANTAGTLPLFAIFVKDAGSLRTYLRWLASDEEVEITTYVLSLTTIVAVVLSLVVEVVVVIDGASDIAAMVRSPIAHQRESASGD